MNIVKATHRFEEWLGRHTRLVKVDLRLKHQRMAEAVFPFLRATFYRWMQIWPEICSDLARAPEVLAVGDLHVENFGTWRDIEGRLVWGVNDFDEASVLPYTIDLVRLATSAILAIETGHLTLRPKVACASMLQGYEDSLTQGGRPFVLEEENTWLRQIAYSVLRDPVHFWRKMDALPRATGKVPVSAKEALEHLMPEPGLSYKTVCRVAGLGSLGHIRLVAIALGLFALSYAGLAISLYPYIVPGRLTIWQASAPASTLGFMLAGGAILLPIILTYTGYAYWVFRGKTASEGYH